MQIIPAVDLHFHLLLVHPVGFPLLNCGTRAWLLLCTCLGFFAWTSTRVILCQHIALAHLNLQSLSPQSYRSLRALGFFPLSRRGLIFLKLPYGVSLLHSKRWSVLLFFKWFFSGRTVMIRVCILARSRHTFSHAFLQLLEFTNFQL